MTYACFDTAGRFHGRVLCTVAYGQEGGGGGAEFTAKLTVFTGG